MSHSFDSWHPGWHVNAVAVWILGLLWGSACWLRYLFHLKFFSKGLITKGVIRERQRKRERERERKKEKERGRGRGRGRRKRKRKRKREKVCSGKVCCNVNPENKPTKVNWTLWWPSLDKCGKTVLWSGFHKGFGFLGKGRQARLFQKQCQVVFHTNIFFKQNGMPRLLATIVNLPNIAWVQNSLFFWPQ